MRRRKPTPEQIDAQVAEWEAKGLIERKEAKAVGGRSDIIEVTLPICPTTNNLYVNVPGRGRVPSNKYKAWKPRAAAILAHTPMWSGDYPVKITIVIVRGKGWREDGDCGNREKAAVDALVENRIIKADNCLHVRPLILDYDPTGSRKNPTILKIRIEKSSTGRVEK